MPVDFEIVRAPSVRAATVSWKGRWDDRRVRREFERLARWAADRRLRTGRWLLTHREPGFQVAIEIRGRASGGGGVTVRRIPAGRVARVRFDPDRIAPRVVYHGLSDWLRWRKKDRTIRASGAYREVYDANPWTNARAWASTEVQVLVR